MAMPGDGAVVEAPAEGPGVARRETPWWVLPGMGMVGEGIFLAGLVMAYHLENATLFNVALGAAIGQAQAVISYFFGSSAGSAKKDETMAASAVKKDEVIAGAAAALAGSVPVGAVPGGAITG